MRQKHCGGHSGWQPYAGSGRVTANGMPVTQLTRAARMQAMTLVPHDAKLFKGTVETNMRMAAPNASEPELWAALEEVNLAASAVSSRACKPR